MKNEKTKFNKTKIVARVMLVVLMLSSVLNLAGCGEPQVKKGQYYDETSYGWSSDDFKTGFRIVSDTNEFPIDDITLSMYIGIKNSEEDVADRLFGSSENVYYVIYATNSVDEPVGPDNANLLNYVYLIKEISYDEVFRNQEYNYFQTLFNERYYNHCEEITIPKECIIAGTADQYSFVRLGLCLVKKCSDDNESQYSQAYDVRYISWSYLVNDDGTVHLGFDHIK